MVEQSHRQNRNRERFKEMEVFFISLLSYFIFPFVPSSHKVKNHPIANNNLKKKNIFHIFMNITRQPM